MQYQLQLTESLFSEVPLVIAAENAATFLTQSVQGVSVAAHLLRPQIRHVNADRR